MSQDYLVMKNITKNFGPVNVLSDITFSAKKGEVHCLLGGNGAGKSTLMNILGGILQKDSGTIEINGQPVEITNPNDSMKCGIAFIHQELKLFSMRTIAENLFISDLPTTGFFKVLDNKKINNDAKQWLDLIELKRDPKTPINKLSIAERQMVEIAKALSRDPQIIIFDEPTSSLTSRETKILFSIIEKLKARNVCIIFISHKFDEIFEICDRVTVIRNGQTIGTVTVKETNSDELINMMIGIRLDQYFPPMHIEQYNEELFSVRNLNNRNLDNVSFSIKKGEILGIFGLVGAGRSELCKALFGVDKIDSGEIFLDNKALKIKNPASAMKSGISYLTEDRKLEGLIMDMDIGTNLNLPIIRKLTIPGISFFRRKRAKQNASGAFKEFSIKANSVRQRVKYLSGGNQQKVVLSKWLLTGSKVFLLDEPTRGVDIAAKADIYKSINRLARNGAAVVVVSSEAPELIGLCHRILVMKDGAIVGVFSHENVKEEELVKLAVGGGTN